MNAGQSGNSRPIYLGIRLEDSQLILSSFTTALREPVELAFQPTQGLGWDCGFLIVEGGDVRELTDKLGADPTVSNVEYLGSIGDDHRFKLLFDGGVPLVPPETTEMGVRVLSTRYEDGFWNVQMHVPVRSTLHRILAHYHDHDITFRVKRLHIARETELGAETALLPGQREALLVAYRNGYFEIPRNVSQEEIACQLNISKSAVSQRIRRAIARLIEATLSP